MMKNQKTQGAFICGPLFFKWIRVFHSWIAFQLEFEHLFKI